jgi:hypothetical protein
MYRTRFWPIGQLAMRSGISGSAPASLASGESLARCSSRSRESCSRSANNSPSVAWDVAACVPCARCTKDSMTLTVHNGYSCQRRSKGNAALRGRNTSHSTVRMHDPCWLFSVACYFLLCDCTNKVRWCRLRFPERACFCLRDETSCCG